MNHDKITFSGTVTYEPAHVTSDSLKTSFTIYYTNYFIQLAQALSSGTLTQAKNQNMVRTSLAGNFEKTIGKEIGLNICQQIVLQSKISIQPGALPEVRWSLSQKHLFVYWSICELMRYMHGSQLSNIIVIVLLCKQSVSVFVIEELIKLILIYSSFVLSLFMCILLS